MITSSYHVKRIAPASCGDDFSLTHAGYLQTNGACILTHSTCYSPRKGQAQHKKTRPQGKIKYCKILILASIMLKFESSLVSLAFARDMHVLVLWTRIRYGMLKLLSKQGNCHEIFLGLKRRQFVVSLSHARPNRAAGVDRHPLPCLSLEHASSRKLESTNHFFVH